MNSTCELGRHSAPTCRTEIAALEAQGYLGFHHRRENAIAGISPLAAIVTLTVAALRVLGWDASLQASGGYGARSGSVDWWLSNTMRR